MTRTDIIADEIDRSRDTNSFFWNAVYTHHAQELLPTLMKIDDNGNIIVTDKGKACGLTVHNWND